MQPNATFIGQTALDAAQQALPLLCLTFYDHAIILQKLSGKDKGMEYPVDPAAVAQALSAKIEFSTGLLNPNTLFVGQSGVQRKVIDYRPPQVTALWLDGEVDPLRVPLPGLIMRRITTDGKSPSYSLYAVQERPTIPDTPLYAAPLPNTGRDGTCWGSVARPTPAQLQGVSLEADWAQYLGSPFGSHQVDDKSLVFPKDIRKHFRVLAGTDSYPLDDLLNMKRSGRTTIGELMAW